MANYPVVRHAARAAAGDKIPRAEIARAVLVAQREDEVKTRGKAHDGGKAQRPSHRPANPVQFAEPCAVRRGRHKERLHVPEPRIGNPQRHQIVPADPRAGYRQRKGLSAHRRRQEIDPGLHHQPRDAVIGDQHAKNKERGDVEIHPRPPQPAEDIDQRGHEAANRRAIGNHFLAVVYSPPSPQGLAHDRP